MPADKIPSIARYTVIPCADISLLVVEYDTAKDRLAPFVERGMDVRFSALAQDPEIS